MVGNRRQQPANVAEFAIKFGNGSCGQLRTVELLLIPCCRLPVQEPGRCVSHDKQWHDPIQPKHLRKWQGLLVSVITKL